MDAKPKAPRWKRLLQNLLLSGAVFFLCLVVAEVALRLAGFGNLEIYEPDAKLYWRLKPNQNCFTKVDRQPVRINSRSTRGPEFAIPKPPGTVRILSLGDSRAFGWGLSEAETYSAVLERLLQAHVGNSNRVEVINAGVNAWSYAQMLVFYRDVAAAWQPDVVLVGEANLWTQFSEQNDARFVRQLMARVRLKNFLRRFALYHYVVEVQLRDFYERNRTKFIPVQPQQDQLFKAQQQADPDAAFRAAVVGICAVAQTNGAQPVLLYLPWLDHLITTNENPSLRIKQSVAAEMQVPLVDASPVLATNAASNYLDADPVHLNAAGNRRVAEFLAARLATTRETAPTNLVPTR